MKYTEFVKANYDKVRNLPAKQRMKAIAEMWKKSKGGAVAGGGIGSDIGNAVDSIGSLFGLGLEKRKRGRPAKKGGAVAGGGIGSDIGNAVDSIGSLFGLGLEKRKRGRPAKKGGAVAGGGVGSDIGNAVDSIGSLFGLGLHKKNKNKNAQLMQAIAELQKKKASMKGGGFNLASLAPLLLAL